MKKIILILGGSFLMVTSSFAKRVYTHTQDGGPSGYRWVSETQNDEYAGLSCYDPGDAECKWKKNPYSSRTVYSYNQIENEVKERITLGEFSGTLYLENNVYVNWESNGINNLTFVIYNF